MRYLRFENLIIDTHNQILIRDGVSVTLAPKVFDLLCYLACNQQRVISKDELMDSVWQGTLVTDNAISRTLVKVRKALGDDPKSPNFILTVPRKGYRMITAFHETDQVPIQTQSYHSANAIKRQSPLSEVRIRRPILSVVALSAAASLTAGVYLYNPYPSPELSINKQVKPYTRAQGEELYPSMSPDLKSLAYVKKTKQLNALIVENVSTHSRQQLSIPLARFSRPSWSPDSEQLAFVMHTPQTCAIYLARVETLLTQSQWQKLSNCGRESRPALAFSKDGKNLYFNDRTSEEFGYQIFQIDLAQKQKSIVNQPITNGRGNYAFDLSPDGRSLVMLNSEFGPKTRIYTLELSSSKLIQTAQLDYQMRSAIWHHDSQSLIHPAPHPAYELWQSTVQGDKLATVVSNTARVKHPARINNGTDFTFVSYLLDRDIYLQRSTDNQTLPLANSSVMDYLPTIANTSSHYAFVSKRSTHAQVYLGDTTQPLAEPVPLTSGKTSYRFYQLAFSPDGSQLLSLADNQLLLTNITTQETTALLVTDMAVRGVSWHSDNQLLFSTTRNNRWQLIRFDLTTHESELIFPEFMGGIYSKHDDAFYLIHRQTGQVFKHVVSSEETSALPLYCTTHLPDRRLTLQRGINGLHCLKDDQSHAHLSITPTDKITWPKQIDNADYQLSVHGIIYTRLQRTTADVMRTLDIQ
ncbi:winged helix-turn-helix domain-containing protein [Pseudoalteromonas rubra]|uniref:winged helix-turn-helix domain-containing protein n=1 Tax=Pseudoalteromonas rubra TaxID=43658 RepID=UPI0014863031|nr:winged helix-turn-helix domain-containing protein [Pseudoalteromonas rubra]